MELLSISFGLGHAMKKLLRHYVMDPNVCEPPKLWKQRNCYGFFFFKYNELHSLDPLLLGRSECISQNFQANLSHLNHNYFKNFSLYLRHLYCEYCDAWCTKHLKSF